LLDFDPIAVNGRKRAWGQYSILSPLLLCNFVFGWVNLYCYLCIGKFDITNFVLLYDPSFFPFMILDRDADENKP
jgi:hypothetical protein